MAMLMISSFNSYSVFFYLTINFLACFALSYDTLYQSVNLNQSGDDIYQSCTIKSIICLSSESNCIPERSCSNLALLEEKNDFFKLTINIFDNLEDQIEASFSSINGQWFKFVCDSRNKSFSSEPSKDILNSSFYQMEKRMVCLTWFKVNQAEDGFKFKVATNEIKSSYLKEHQPYYHNLLQSYRREPFIYDNFLFNTSKNKTGNKSVLVNKNVTILAANESIITTAKPNNSTKKAKKKLDYVMLLGYALPFLLFFLIILVITIKKMSRQEDEAGEGEGEAENSEASRSRNGIQDQTVQSNEAENQV